MLNGEDPGVWNEAVRHNTTSQAKNKRSDFIIDIEPTTTMVELTKTHTRRSRLTAAEQVTRKCLQRSVSISIAVLARRHVRFRFHQEPTSSDIDGMETVPLIPDEFNKTVRIQRSSTTADIVTDLGEIATLLSDVNCITTINDSKRTKQILFINKKRDSPTLRDILTPGTSRTQINVTGEGSIQVGPKFVTVNQKVVNKEVITGKYSISIFLWKTS